MFKTVKQFTVSIPHERKFPFQIRSSTGPSVPSCPIIGSVSEAAVQSCSVKKDVLKNLAIFTREHLCWSRFLITLRTFKRFQGCFPVKTAKCLRTGIFKNICKQLFLQFYWNIMRGNLKSFNLLIKLGCCTPIKTIRMLDTLMVVKTKAATAGGWKKVVLKSFPIFTGKHPCWSLFLTETSQLICRENQLTGFYMRRPATLLKRNSNTGDFLWILRDF